MPGLLPLPLHAGLTAEEQQEIFETPPRDTRKVIVSTNIAEASVTIEGIKYVVDCGFVKVRVLVGLAVRFLSQGKGRARAELALLVARVIPQIPSSI